MKPLNAYNPLEMLIWVISLIFKPRMASFESKVYKVVDKFNEENFNI